MNNYTEERRMSTSTRTRSCYGQPRNTTPHPSSKATKSCIAKRTSCSMNLPTPSLTAGVKSMWNRSPPSRCSSSTTLARASSHTPLLGICWKLSCAGYERFSTLLTSNRPLEDWGKLLGDVTAVSTMLDRLPHQGHVLNCGSRSWRTKVAAGSA